ncbi:MAG: dienelactone hydrolase family protein [Candidatus Eremiobacteraeota bacterium]|nr:dienelactone hydrolase family protein [Candidatus Eremiobacteraeota bacterium]
MGKHIEFDRPDGKRAPGYLAEPEDASAPGIVVIEEWWGVTKEVRDIADAYARAGFRALVPDLFRGRTAATGDEATHLMEGLDFSDAADQDVRGALRFLKAGASRVGVTGYCMGGAVTILAAAHASEADAAVSFYGVPPADAIDPSTIKIPFEGHFAARDAFFTPKAVLEFERRLKTGGAKSEIYWYEADHGFCNSAEAGKSGLGHYDATNAKLAWERTLEFWNRNLR